MKFIEELDQTEVEHLFIAEDTLKSMILKGYDNSKALEFLQDRIKKIYVVPTAK